MAERNLLHKNKLDLLKHWLSSKGYEIQDTKSIYEVLRANNGEDTVIIFKQNGAKEHLTVQDKDYKLIRQFIQETRKKQTNYDRIRNMSVEELARFRNNTSICNMCIFDYARDCAQTQQDCYMGVKQWLEAEVTE